MSSKFVNVGLFILQLNYNFSIIIVKLTGGRGVLGVKLEASLSSAIVLGTQCLMVYGPAIGFDRQKSKLT